MKKYLSSIVIGLVLFLTGMTVALTGYGHVLVYGQLFVILAILFAVAHLTFRRGPAPFALYVSKCVIVFVLGVTGLAIGSWTLVYRKREVCVECDKVLSALDEYKAHNGRYPKNLKDIGVKKIAEITIRQGKSWSEDGGVGVAGINYADATIYLSPERYLCLVPVTKMLPMSFTRFYVLEKSSVVANWKYHKIIWYFGAI